MDQKEVPIIVGVADVRNGSKKVDDAIEPIQLMLQAIDLAIKDANTPSSHSSALRSSIDSIDVVSNWTWQYTDAPNLIVNRLGLVVKHASESEQSGSQPAKLLDEAARRISNRECRVALVTGGESLASYAACAAANKIPPPNWTKPSKISDPISPKTALLPPGTSRIHGLGRPTQLYAMYEVALAAHRGQTIKESIEESAQMYSQFAEIAEKNPYAWNYRQPAKLAREIGNVTDKNRMICLPYPLLLNAFNTVNLAAACILTSVGYAEELGIPKEKWIYMRGGAGTSDQEFLWERTNFASSVPVSLSLDAALQVAELGPKDIDLVDIYSCFPVVPKLAALHLGYPLASRSKPLTLTGGMNSFGGAGNNYSMHAATEMVRQLRNGRGKNGLVLANGGHLTYEHVVILSVNPWSSGRKYPDQNPLPKLLVDNGPILEVVALGEAFIETYTVEFNRDGSPDQAFIIGRLGSSGRRFVANHGDAVTLNQLSNTSRLHVGRKGYVFPDNKSPERNRFSLEPVAQI